MLQSKSRVHLQTEASYAFQHKWLLKFSSKNVITTINSKICFYSAICVHIVSYVHEYMAIKIFSMYLEKILSHDIISCSPITLGIGKASMLPL